VGIILDVRDGLCMSFLFSATCSSFQLCLLSISFLQLFNVVSFYFHSLSSTEPQTSLEFYGSGNVLKIVRYIAV